MTMGQMSLNTITNKGSPAKYMNDKLLIKAKSLKDFLGLFDGNIILDNLSLGDTLHPSSGYVDEELLGDKRSVSELLEFDYDFRGLVAFSCSIGTMTVNLVDGERYPEIGEYEIQGTTKDIAVLQNKVIEENSYSPSRYEIRIVLSRNQKS
jgi:hypothetical protein